MTAAPPKAAVPLRGLKFTTVPLASTVAVASVQLATSTDGLLPRAMSVPASLTRVTVAWNVVGTTLPSVSVASTTPVVAVAPVRTYGSCSGLGAVVW